MNDGLSCVTPENDLTSMSKDAPNLLPLPLSMVTVIGAMAQFELNTHTR